MAWMTEAGSVLSRSVSIFKFCEKWNVKTQLTLKSYTNSTAFNLFLSVTHAIINHAVKKHATHISPTMKKPTTVDGLICSQSLSVNLVEEKVSCRQVNHWLTALDHPTNCCIAIICASSRPHFPLHHHRRRGWQPASKTMAPCKRSQEKCRCNMSDPSLNPPTEISNTVQPRQQIHSTQNEPDTAVITGNMPITEHQRT